MRTLVAILMAGLVLSSCAQSDATFDSLYDQFLADSVTNNGIDLSHEARVPITFAALGGQANPLGDTIGECFGVGYGVGYIQIDKQFWDISTDDARKLLIYHELGHCLLNLQHVTNPESIMYPIINYPEGYFNADWSQMLSMLFAH